MSDAGAVSVIIPAYNASSSIDLCLHAIQVQTCPPTEVIVVDDGSTDNTARIAESYGVRVIRQANQGPGSARNHGVEASRGDILLFTDSDCAPVAEWVERMLEGFSDPMIAGVKGTYLTRQQSWIARFVQLEYENRYDRMVGKPSIDFVDTYSAGYRREVFETVGGFDEDLRMDQDQELSFRISEAGYRLVFVPKAQVYHIHDERIQEYFRRKFWIGYWKVRVVHRHPKKLVQDSHTPQILKIQILLAALGALLIVVGILDARVAWIGLVLWAVLVVSGMPFLFKILRRDPPVLVVAPLILFLRAWALGLGFLAGSVGWLVDKAQR